MTTATAVGKNEIDNGDSGGINDGYDYDPTIVDLFRKQREEPYAKADLARLNKEDDEASEEEEEKDSTTQHVGLASAIAYKHAVMESMNPVFFPDRWL